MFPPDYSEEYEGLISDLARRRCRMQGIEFEDLCQEARLEVWTKILMGLPVTENDLINAMRRSIRATKAGRGVVYEPNVSELQSLSPR
jgi:hypothetical protein